MNIVKYSNAMLMPTFTIEAVIKNENGRFDFSKDEMKFLVDEVVRKNECDVFRPGQNIQVPIVAD